jgi:hypothetical protein
MERNQILNMEPFILLSWTNMKLRDHFDSISGLCEDYDILEGELTNRLKEIGYRYCPRNNQFVGV